MNATQQVKLETKEPTRYKFRAEFLGDVLAFFDKIIKTKQGLMNVHVNPDYPNVSGGWSDDSNPIMDVVASFGTFASKETLTRLLDEIPDSHVMWQTIVEESEYTGIRGDVPFVAVTE